MKKILFISHDASRTGAPIVLLHFLRWFRENTSFPFLILLREGGDLESEFEAVGPVIALSRGFFSEETLPEQLASHNIGLIYSNTIVNGLLLRKLSCLQCPVISHIHELEQTIRYYFSFDLFEGVKQNTHHYIAASEAVRANLLLNHSIPEKKLEVVYEFIPINSNSVNLAKARQQIYTELSIPENSFIVGGCGTTSWRKGIDIFAQLLYIIRKQRTDVPIYFLWVGGSTNSVFFHDVYNDIKQLKLEPYISFIGVKSNPLHYFAAFDAFALVSREDPFPLVCLEAASLGKPIVCFDGSGGMKEFVKEDCGFVVPYLDIEVMADRILKLLDSPELRDRLGQHAQLKVKERHDVNIVAPEILKIIQRFFPEPDFSEISDRDTTISILEMQHTQLNSRFQGSQAQLQQTQDQLQQTQDQLQQTQDQLQQTQDQLQQTQDQLQQTQDQLQQTQQQFNKVTAVVGWMETSKFWKLRSALLRLKQNSGGGVK